MGVDVTEVLSEGVLEALRTAGLPEPGAVPWEVPRETEHGDYATNLAMLMARSVKQSPRRVAEAIRDHLPQLEAVERVEVAGPGFLHVFLTPEWCREALREVLRAGEAYGRSDLRSEEG